ncbi:hypothetical protein GGF31_008512 [Allomyces arbusculus]|nr:hypothetical protein GGF31_008512 [Allomyces arbusculus]
MVSRTTDPPLPFCVSGRRVEHPSVTAAAAAARAAADHAARVAADALAAQQAALRAGLPRFAQAVETLEEQLQHIDILKRAHGLIGKAHGGLGTLPAAERVEMLEFLVHRGRQEGKGESLDQIIEQVLWEMRRNGEVAAVHRAADAERDAAAVEARRAIPPRAAWRGSGVDVLGGRRTPARDLASDATNRTGTTERSSPEPTTKRALAGTRSLPASPQQRKDRGRSDRLDAKERDLLLSVINKWRRPSSSVHAHSTPSSPGRDRDRARTSRTPTKSPSLAAKDPSLSPKEQAAVDKVLRLWKKPTTVAPSITTSRHDSDASMPHSRLVSIGPSRVMSRSPSCGEPHTTDYAALMQSAHALLQPVALAKTASASGYLIPAAPPSPSGSSPILAVAASKALALDSEPAVTLHVPTVSARASRSASRDLPALRITDEGDDEPGKGTGSSAAALSAIQNWKSRIKQMKKAGLGNPTSLEASPTSAKTLVNPTPPRTPKSPRPSSTAPSTPVKGVDRDATNFRARAVPASSLVPKFHQMMQADRARRERHHQEYVAMLQTQLTPFKFEYSEMLKKRREECKASQQELDAKLAREQAKLDRADSPSLRRQQHVARDLSNRAAAARPPRRAPSPPPDVRECTFHPITNPTVPDFSRAQEEHAAALAARKAAIRARLAARHVTTPFPGVEAHQRLLEDRKRKTLAKVRAALSPTPVKRTPAAPATPPPPEPKPTRSSTLKVQARIRAQEERERREREEREERGVRMARRAAVQRQVQAALEEEARMKEAKGEMRTGAGSPSSEGEDRYRQFLEDMEMRVMARPFAFQKADLESRAKKLVHESVGSIMAKHGVNVNTLKPMDPARETMAT